MLNLSEKTWFDPTTDSQCFRATFDGERIIVRVSIEVLEDGIGRAEIAKLAETKIKEAMQGGTPVPPEVLITANDRSLNHA